MTDISYRSDVSLALLAGGLSSRMGEDKAFATFEDGTLLEWMRDRTAPLFPHVFAVTRDPSRFHELGIPVVNDALAVEGSAVGVYTAVLAAPTERVLCLACDMPFVTARLLWELAAKSEGLDVFVPRHGEFMQPLCAVYGKGTLDAYREFIIGGGRRIFDIYPDLNTGFLEVGDGRFGDPDRLFLNVNTPEELEAARRAVAPGGEG
ncbi:MAG TPA: molybdenum cofactor guanylyltransferase, partial [Thermoleophilia bacterium]|nr:molybdenum cofactor guanylyltransferase [Thermoleophilia bacterium]